MEPNDLLPRSRDTTTCPYTEPDQSSPHDLLFHENPF